MCGNEFETKENKNLTQGKIEQEIIHALANPSLLASIRSTLNKFMNLGDLAFY